jgi:hypothetical protein
LPTLAKHLILLNLGFLKTQNRKISMETLNISENELIEKMRKLSPSMQEYFFNFNLSFAFKSK